MIVRQTIFVNSLIWNGLVFVGITLLSLYGSDLHGILESNSKDRKSINGVIIDFKSDETNTSLQDLNLTFSQLYKQKELLMDIFGSSQLFMTVLQMYPNGQTEISQQSELLEMCSHDRIDVIKVINNLVGFHTFRMDRKYISFDNIYRNKECLLRAFGSTQFVIFVFKIISPYYEDEVRYQKLVEFGISKGADMNIVVEKMDHHLSIKLLHTMQDYLLKVLGPTKFLAIVMRETDTWGNDYKQNLKLKLAKMAIEAGADVNGEAGYCQYIQQVDDLELLNLLLENGAICKSIKVDEMREAGLYNLLFNPDMVIMQKYKHLTASGSPELKVPHLMHHIWLTDKSSPNEIPLNDIANAITTKEIFSRGKGQWEHIIWTNDISLIPKSIERLESSGISVKSIYESHCGLQLFDLIENFIEKQKWGIASDILRYSLLNKFGGVYADLNYVFNRDVTSETYKYNFFTVQSKGILIDNYFFGSSPKHPIFKRVLELVKRNMVSPPRYLSTIPDQDSRIIADKGTANPLYLAYYSEANKDGNIDVVYPITGRTDVSSLTDNSLNEEENEDAKYLRKILNEACFESELYRNFLESIRAKEICGSEHLGIGHDSGAGLTWLKN